MLPRLLLLAALAAGPLSASPQTPLGPGTTAGPATHAPIQGPWNVLVVLTDQQHASALGIAGNGFGGVPTSLTPNLDALAEDGVLFESAYCAQAQCCPSRYSLITGLEPHRHGLRFNGIWEPTAEVTVPELLRDAGYETATIGKHHFRWLSQSAPLAFDHGFSEVLDLSDYRSYCNQNGVPTFDAPGHHWRMPGLPVVGGIERSGVTDCPNEFHPSGYFADRAIDYLSERAQDRQPFYCHLSFYGPHSPILPSGPTDPRDFAHAFFPPGQLTLPPNFQRPPTTQRLDDLQQQFAGVSDAQHRELLAYYFGLIHQIDFNIGRVLDHLEQVGLADRTLVVFTSDHGEFASEFGVWTKALGGLEATARVPLIARLPVGLRGERRSELVTGVDLAPTVLELTGVPVPSEVRAGLSGRSWLPLLLGEPPAPAWRSTVFGEARGGQVRYARNATHKVIEDASVIPDVELYDLASDPFEVVDLLDPAAPGSGAIRDALLAEIDDWWGDPLQHAPDYRDAGAAADLPVIASAPLPANGANGVATDVDFAWLRSSASQSQAVYLGTAPGALQPLAVLSGEADSANPGTLAPGTTYYWRVDGSNPNGLATGLVWSFTTDLQGQAGPELTQLSAPLEGQTVGPVATTLRWVPASDAIAHQVYFGERGAPLLQVASLPSWGQEHWQNGLESGAEYRWRVDTRNASGVVTEGSVWSFRVNPSTLPSAPTRPHPRHLARGFHPPQLTWAAAPGATSYSVHLGTSQEPPLVATVSQPRHATPALQPATTYYWRVDAVGTFGTKKGTTWRFRTGP